jgi:hypothetical protein
MGSVLVTLALSVDSSEKSFFQVKNGLTKSADVSEVLTVEKYELLEPLDNFEENLAEEYSDNTQVRIAGIL